MSGHIGASKLTLEKANLIKELLTLGEFTHQQIADLFGVSRELVTQINLGNRWNLENNSFVMKKHLEQVKSNDYREFSNPYKPKVHSMTNYEIEFITDKISTMIEKNDKTVNDIKSITINFE